MQIYIDTDTANEVDDPYAVFRAIVAPEVEVVGLSSESWMTSEPFAHGAYASHKMNQEVLELMGLTQTVSCPLGALSRMPTKMTPVDSEAARDIIAKAHQLPTGQKLPIFVLGCFTNVASALLLDQSIKGKVSIWLMGYQFEDGWFSTQEWNCLGDPNAAEHLLESDVGLFVMPQNLLRQWWWQKSDVDTHFKGKGGIKDYLVQHWETVSPEKSQRILWDIAIFEAFLRPHLATLQTVDRDGRTVHVWTQIDEDGMQSDYWAATDPYIV